MGRPTTFSSLARGEIPEPRSRVISGPLPTDNQMALLNSILDDKPDPGAWQIDFGGHPVYAYAARGPGDREVKATTYDEFVSQLGVA